MVISTFYYLASLLRKIDCSSEALNIFSQHQFDGQQLFSLVILKIGDPSTAKSQLLKFTQRVSREYPHIPFRSFHANITSVEFALLCFSSLTLQLSECLHLERDLRQLD